MPKPKPEKKEESFPTGREIAHAYSKFAENNPGETDLGSLVWGWGPNQPCIVKPSPSEERLHWFDRSVAKLTVHDYYKENILGGRTTKTQHINHWRELPQATFYLKDPEQNEQAPRLGIRLEPFDAPKENNKFRIPITAIAMMVKSMRSAQEDQLSLERTLLGETTPKVYSCLCGAWRQRDLQWQWWTTLSENKHSAGQDALLKAKFLDKERARLVVCLSKEELKTLTEELEAILAKLRNGEFQHLADQPPEPTNALPVNKKEKDGQIDPGIKVRATVVSLTPYAAFVSLEGKTKGMIHISDMSWTKRISHPSSLLNPGDTVEAVILSVDNRTGHVSLGLKQLQPDPWKTIQNHYKVGDTVAATIHGHAPYGAFAETQEGFQALLHISEVSSGHLEQLPESLGPGVEITAKVVGLGQEHRRLQLSLKAMAYSQEEFNKQYLQEPPQTDTANTEEEYRPGDRK